MSLENRNIRQRDLIPTDKLTATDATIVGVGAIGRQVALQLATIGVGHLKLIDPDTVEVENLSAQGFPEKQLGLHKVIAVGDTCQTINSKIKVDQLHRRFRNLDFTNDVMFCCVDSIDTRKEIFTAVQNRCDLFVDGRMSAEFMRVLTVHNDKSREYYDTQLFPSSEAYIGACTARSTIYCANICAGIMVAQFAKWIRGVPIDCNIELNTLTNEMTARE